MFEKKQIFKLNILKQLLNDENACVTLVPSTRLLALPPFFLNDMKSGILYLLNSMLKKYDRSLGGIVIGYQNIKVLMDENTGIIPMGASEIEINISAEFYIFQPKVGSFLEGIVNKKSSNHIGCLVHQYFNATILKAEDVDFDEWKCKNFNVDDKILFKVKELDFTSLLPHIEGVVENEDEFNRESCVEEEISNEQKVSPSKKHFNLEKLNKESESEFLANANGTNKNSEVKLVNLSENKVINKNDISFEKKLEKKKEKNKNISICFTQEEDTKKGMESSVSFCEKISEKSVENEKSDAFVIPFKVKKKEKKKKKKELFNKRMSESLSAIEEREEREEKEERKEREEKDENQIEENMFCSTQLEPGSESRMLISFCSPIREGVYSEVNEGGEKERKRSETLGVGVMSGQERKRRSGKREREMVKVEGNGWFCLGWGGVESERSVLSEMSEGLDESVGENGECKKSEKSIVKNLKEKNELNGEKEEECNVSGREWKGLKEEEEEEEGEILNKKKERLKKKRKFEESGNDWSSNCEKVIKEGKRKSEKDVKMKREKKKGRTAEEVSEGSVDSLYNKLLRDAISAINGGGEDWNGKEEKCFSVAGGRKRRKGMEAREEKGEGEGEGEGEAEGSLRNGSMYDVSYSPEKVRADKSLFSDSEQSHSSPVKKLKLTNGEAIGRKSCEVAKTKTKAMATRESSNEKSRKKLKKNSEESLYEKLLKEAKKRIEI